MAKVLTIVVPTYNVEKYLDRCILSLTADKDILDMLDIIIVNDGSKDNSLKIAREYEKKFPNCIRVVDKENGGHGSTINRGLKEARGKYFRILDSDDWVNIDDFPKYVKDLSKLDVDIIVTDYTLMKVFDSSEFVVKYNIEKNKKTKFDDLDLKKLYPNYFGNAAITFKTEKLRKANLYLDEKCFYVDMEYIVLPIKEIDSYIYLDYNIYRYFIGRIDQSVNIDSYVKNRKMHEKVLKRLIDFYEKEDLTETKHEYVKYIISFMLNSHYSIYTKAKLPSKDCKKEIKEFDKYLKDNAKDLYTNTNKLFRSIKWNRNTKYLFAQGKRKLFSRLADFKDVRKRNKKKNKELKEAK